MIDLSVFSSELLEACATEPLLFLEWDPTEPDSTTLVNFNFKLLISGLHGFNRSFTLTSDNYIHVLSLFDSIITAKKKPVIGYNFKTLFSVYKRLSKRSLNISNFIDLYWYESYRSLQSSVNNKNAALLNFKSMISDSSVFSLYKNLYSDLIGKVIPSIESFAFVNDDTGKIVYSNYHIEGQENGRLSCSCEKKNTFNPHSLGEDKKNLVFFDMSFKYFLQFDYKNMEVSVLASMSADEQLLNIVQSPENNVYERIFEIITNVKNHADAKLLGKKLFLPLIYGQTQSGLSKNLDISIDQAEIYINQARKIFKKSFEFVEDAQTKCLKQGYVEDVFGRKRLLEKTEAYKARNFIIQSPSALICLEALLKLYKNTNDLFSIAFHVHDGYFLAIKKDNIQDAFFSAKNILESKTELMPDLNLRVSSKAGMNLEKMFLLDKRK